MPSLNSWLRAGFAGLLAAATLCVSSCGPGGRNEGPALWRVADEDSEIWLFGTVHVLPRSMRWRNERIDAAFNAADTVVFETDVGPEGAARLQTLFLEQGYDRTGEPLSARLPAEDSARFIRVARKFGVSPALLEPMRPWYAALQLSFLALQAEGQEADSGVEAVLSAEADAQNKRRAYLETAEEQVGFLANLPADVELEFLITSLRQIEEEDQSIAALDAAWARGDTERLAALLNGLIEEAGPEVHAALITDRNARWTRDIEAMLAGEGRIFIAVGAAHLVGRDSVVAQLRARGHTVEGP
ncbi:MAG: TraB/GumN family protein [Hyphomonadaceae bacterium]